MAKMTEIAFLYWWSVKHNCKHLLYEQIIVLFNLDVDWHVGEFLEDILQQGDSPVLSRTEMPWWRF